MNSYIYKPTYISTVFEIILKYEEDGTLYFFLTSDQYKIYCYGWPLLQAWLLPDLNTIPKNCVRENSL